MRSALVITGMVSLQPASEGGMSCTALLIGNSGHFLHVHGELKP